MKISTKGKYAVVAMVDIARNYKVGDYISLLHISNRNNLSVAYLEQLFAKLKKAQLVISAKGPKGGYMLAKPPCDIFVSEIISAVDEDTNLLKCNHLGKECTKEDDCHDSCLWSNLVDHVDQYLGALSLKHLANNQFKIIENEG